MYGPDAGIADSFRAQSRPIKTQSLRACLACTDNWLHTSRNRHCIHTVPLPDPHARLPPPCRVRHHGVDLPAVAPHHRLVLVAHQVQHPQRPVLAAHGQAQAARGQRGGGHGGVVLGLQQVAAEVQRPHAQEPGRRGVGAERARFVPLGFICGSMRSVFGNGATSKGRTDQSSKQMPKHAYQPPIVSHDARSQCHTCHRHRSRPCPPLLPAH